jgi:hypothetical protein
MMNYEERMEIYRDFLEEYAEYPQLFDSRDISCEEEAIVEAAGFADVWPQYLGASLVRGLRAIA